MTARSARYISAIRTGELIPRLGKVREYAGSVLVSSGPDVALGELCEIYAPGHLQPVLAETAGFRDGNVLLMPYGDLHGVRPGSEVVATGRVAKLPVGRQLLGRIVDPFGLPMDGRPMPGPEATRPLYAPPLNPVRRARISKIFETKVRAIDTFLTIGQGQRIGIFAGSGVGKSSLLGMIARSSKADVNVVALIGERGREVREFIEFHLGDALAKSVIVVATAEQSALLRSHAAFAATAIAEYFRDQGLTVALFVDSLTRFAMARREVGLAVGEPPTSRGYTPSVFGALPRLLERAGPGEAGKGLITGFYTVLVEGDDLNEPIADNTRAILDGHIVLSREIANQGRYPSIDILKSLSRLLPHLTAAEDLRLIAGAVKTLALYEESKDLVELGGYKAGANKALDTALHVAPLINNFLTQSLTEGVGRESAMESLRRIVREQPP
jgi:flagellum-specific ATP synthase